MNLNEKCLLKAYQNQSAIKERNFNRAIVNELFNKITKLVKQIIGEFLDKNQTKV